MTKESNLKNFVSKPVDVTGFTTINHNIRLKCLLTCSEYVLLDYIYTVQIKGKIPEMGDCYRKTGFNEKEQDALVAALVKKGFILLPKDNNQTAFEITELWTRHFHSTEAEFENLFWMVYDQEKKKNVVAWPGSKPQALKNYILVRKNNSLEFLLKQREWYFKYLDAVRETGFPRQKMMCSVFLGPQERYLENWQEQYETIKPSAKEEKPKVKAATSKEIDKLYEKDNNK